MRVEEILAIGFVAAAECRPRSLDELARAAGFQVVDGLALAVWDSLIVVPASTSEHDRNDILAAVMGAAAHRWAGEPRGVSPAEIAQALELAVGLSRARRAAS